MTKCGPQLFDALGNLVPGHRQPRIKVKTHDTTTDFNSGTVTVPWDQTAIYNYGGIFTHDPVTNNSRITVNRHAIYGFMVNLNFTSSGTNRVNLRGYPKVTGAFKEDTARNSYIRNASSANESSLNWYIEQEIAADGYLEIVTQLEAGVDVVNMMSAAIDRSTIIGMLVWDLSVP